jgi:hypothetical protein
MSLRGAPSSRDNSGVGRRWRDAALLVEPRRRRRVARLLRKMDRLEARSVRRRPAGGHGRAATAVAVLVLMLGGLFVTTLLGEDRSASASAYPDRPPDAEAAPIGTPPDVRKPSNEFAFMRTQDGSSDPVTYDPCVPIHILVDPRTSVDDGMRLLEEALDEMQDATGLAFVVDGLTDDPRPSEGTIAAADGGPLPARVAWSDPGTDESLEGGVTGTGGSVSVKRDGHWWFVTGTILLDGPQLAEILTGPRGWQAARAVVMHELGHLVGLNHVETPGQLMQPEGDESLTTWGDGDLTGLAALGRGKCVNY